jgi:hypothetical protein
VDYDKYPTSKNRKKSYQDPYSSGYKNKRKILALEVTDVGEYGGAFLKKPINQVLDEISEPNTPWKIKSGLADWSSGSNTYIRYLDEEKKYKPGISVRKNAIISTMINRLRNKEVTLQQKICRNGRGK